MATIPILEKLAKKIIPETVKRKRRRKQFENLKSEIASLPALSEEEFFSILTGELGLKTGDIVLVHSAVDCLNLSFPPKNILGLLRDAVGGEGTLVFPTYPLKTSYEFLKSGEVFDVRKSVSYSGILTEIARRLPGSVRSLHPTKSVCAIGPLANELVSEHHISPYPYDYCSPYYKLGLYNGKAIGLGVDTTFNATVHCSDDFLKKELPINPNHRKLFNAKCINYEGKETIVKTYGHNMGKMIYNLPLYYYTNIPLNVFCDMKIKGMKFYWGLVTPFIRRMIDLARKGITIYPWYFYKTKWKLRILYKLLS